MSKCIKLWSRLRHRPANPRAGAFIWILAMLAPLFWTLAALPTFAHPNLSLVHLTRDSNRTYLFPLIAKQPTPTPTPTPSPTFTSIPTHTPTPTPTPQPTSVCPRTSENHYPGSPVYQTDLDNPVRPAHLHADKNFNLRAFTLNTDPNLKRDLIDYGTDDPTQPPQFATLFRPHRIPSLVSFHKVHDWIWAPSPDPGRRGDPITRWPVTALGLQTTPGERLHVPHSAYDIGAGMEAMVIYADEHTIAMRYAREDSAGYQGYTVHVTNICTDPNLLALYQQLDHPTGPRYIYVPPEQHPYSYNLPGLYVGQSFGVARGAEIVVAIVDTGSYMDPRSCNEWWQIRPGYAGTCPPP